MNFEWFWTNILSTSCVLYINQVYIDGICLRVSKDCVTHLNINIKSYIFEVRFGAEISWLQNTFGWQIIYQSLYKQHTWSIYVYFIYNLLPESFMWEGRALDWQRYRNWFNFHLIQNKNFQISNGLINLLQAMIC